MEAFLNNDNPNCIETFIPVIFEEDGLKGDASELIQDLVFFTIQDGKQLGQQTH